MFAALTLALLATATVEAPLKLAAPGLSSPDLDGNKAQFLNDYFAEQVGRRSGKRITVVTESQVQQMLGLERQKQLLGCNDDNSECLAEIAGALGVEGLILGSVARFGTQYAVMVRVISSPEGATLWSASDRGLREEQLVDWMASSAGAMVAALGTGGRRPDAPGATAPAARGVHNNELWLNLVAIEYVRRLGGGRFWLGGRAGANPGFSPTFDLVIGALAIARYDLAQPHTPWKFSLVGGAGLGGTLLEQGGFAATLGVDTGYKMLRLSGELTWAGEGVAFVPRLSLAIPF